MKNLVRALCFMLLIVILSSTLALAGEKRLMIGAYAETHHLDSRLDIGITGMQRLAMINEPLIIYNRNMELAPRLATDWYHSDDGLQMTFYLQEGVQFHHGREFTAKDVKYTYDWILDPENEAQNRDLYTDVKEIEIVDDHTVVFHLHRPNGFLINNMARIHIVPYDKDEELGHDFRFQPIGTGPFQFVSWTRDDRMIFEAFHDYWGGSPQLDVIEFRPIPEDSARLLAFEAGEIHMFHGYVVADEVSRLEEDDRFVVQRKPGTGYHYLGLNTKNPYLNDYRIRRAIAYMVDREGIVESLMSGIGRPGATSISPTLPWFHDGLTPYTFDEEKARDLLAQAGYPDGGFTLNIYSDDNPVRRQIAEIMAYQLEEHGIQAHVHVEEYGAYIERILRTDDYDIWVWAWVGQLDPDRATYRQFHSSGGSNWSYFKNSRLDLLVEKGRIVPADSQESLDIYREVQEILHREQPYIYLFYEEEVGVSQTNIRGWELHPYSGQTFMDAHLIDIVPE